MPSAEQAAVARAKAMFAPPAVEAEETPSSDTTDVEEPVVEAAAPEETVTEEDEPSATIQWPSWEMNEPDDLKAELEAEDDEPAPVATVEDDELDEFEEDDEHLTAAEAKRLAKLEKENAYLREQRVKEKLPAWREEAAKFYPASVPMLEGIKADSRRSFMKQAKEAHTILAPILSSQAEAQQAAMEAEIERVRAEAKEEAAKAWGQTPTGRPLEPAQESTETNSALERARSRGDLVGSIKAMMGGER